MLAIDADKVSVSILLNGRPFRRLVLRQTVEVNPVDANCECQDRQQEHDRQLPDTVQDHDIGPHSAHLLPLTSAIRCPRTSSRAHEFTSDVVAALRLAF